MNHENTQKKTKAHQELDACDEWRFPMDTKKLATMLEDYVAEENWDATLANSHDKLAALADEALSEFEQGETRPLEESL